MDDAYYRKLGFKCGIEIHQRLDTDEKLFCACSTEQNGESIGKVYRMQRAVAGELGSIDKSAQFEELRKRRFEYNLFRGTTCLMDIDEEPPHGISREALLTTLELAHAMRMNILNEIEPMRKGVVDGSDPSAFQRTMMVGLDGSIKVNGFEVLIPTVCLEEESAGIASDYGTEIAYKVDRLGIPLIEVATFADIPTPEIAKETALYIGALLRLTGKVKRGLGTIRQDVNVSIKEGARIEMKGLQDVSVLDKFIDNEIRRQTELIDIAKLLKKGKAEAGKPVDVSRIFESTKAELVKSKLAKGGIVMAFRLHGFKGLLGREINPNRRLGTEISDYAKAAGAGGIIHSDEHLSTYGFDEKEINALRKELDCSESDSFIVVAENRNVVASAMRIARERALQAIEGVPVETRTAINDNSCTSKFIRPLPGGSRMYPETDAHPVYLDEKTLSEARKKAPNLERETRALKAQLGDDDTVKRMLKSTRLQAYKTVSSAVKSDNRFIANVILQKFTELGRNGYDIDSISEGRLIEVFAAYSKGTITKQAIDELLKSLSKEDSSVDAIIKQSNLERIKGGRLSNLITSIKKETKTSDPESIRKSIMAKHRLNIDGEELNGLLKGA